jgi:hypothetical protein
MSAEPGDIVRIAKQSEAGKNEEFTACVVKTGNNISVCDITVSQDDDNEAIPIIDVGIEDLVVTGFIHPSRLLAVDPGNIQHIYIKLNNETRDKVIAAASLPL